MISESTKLRFAHEVAKYPPGQQASAVIACLNGLRPLLAARVRSR